MKTLVKFNVQNIHYAVSDASGQFKTPVPYGTGIKISLEANTSSKIIRGDGKIIAEIINDKGKTGSFTTNNISNDYEVAMGRKMIGQNGLMDVQQVSQITHALYFETCELREDEKITVAKTWVYNVTSKRPNESYDQNGDDINESTFETPITIKGTKLLNADKTPYVDSNGNELLVWQQTVVPGDTGYEDFVKAVVLPIFKSITETTSTGNSTSGEQ